MRFLSFCNSIALLLALVATLFTFDPTALASETSANAPTHTLRIVLVGDSTVTESAGWGRGFKQFVNEQAECIDVAAGGRSSMSFIKEGRWEKALALKADYYLIQFGHNDEPGKPGCSTDPNTDYRAYMNRYVDEARSIGAKPILVTSLVRRGFDKSNPHKINSSLQPYVDVVKQIATEKHVPLVDLHARSKELCESLGQEKCLAFCPTKVVDGKTTYDTTHLNANAGVVMAQLVVEELRKAAPELTGVLRTAPGPIANIKEFNVRQYGAVGDGKTLDTEAIQKALDTCGQAGGGIVRLPPGTYLSKPIFLKVNTTLLLESGTTLQATSEATDFVQPGKPGATLALVNAIGYTGVGITGSGRIDGASARGWATPSINSPDPVGRLGLVAFSECVQDVTLEGVTLQNSPSDHLALIDCEGVKIDGVTVRSPQKATGTRAMDFDGTRHLTMAKCVLDVGDDNLVIEAPHLDPPHPNGAAEDIVISDCTFLHGRGLVIGSQILGGVRAISVSNCIFDSTTDGIRVESARGRGGLLQNLAFKNLTMTNVDCPIRLASYSLQAPIEDVAMPMSVETPVYRNIRIENLKATGAGIAGEIIGLPESPITDVVFDHVHIAALRGMTVRHAKGIHFTASQIEAKTGPPLVIKDAEVEGLQP